MACSVTIFANSLINQFIFCIRQNIITILQGTDRRFQPYNYNVIFVRNRVTIVVRQTIDISRISNREPQTHDNSGFHNSISSILFEVEQSLNLTVQLFSKPCTQFRVSLLDLVYYNMLIKPKCVHCLSGLATASDSKHFGGCPEETLSSC